VELSIVIPTHNRPSSLKALLSSLTDQNLSSSKFEIHVVGNLAEDPGQHVTFEMKKVLPNLHWHCVGAIGVNRARNWGLKKAKAEIILFLDDDCIVTHRYYLNTVVSAHAENPDVVAIGGAYVSSPGAATIDRAYNRISSQWLERRSSADGRFVNLVGGNVSYKKSQLVAKGLEFNEKIVFGGAETDLHSRILASGGRLLFLKDLNVEHRPALNLRALIRKAFLQGMAAQFRRRTGLFVATRPRLLDLPVSELENFWIQVFHYSFRLGEDFAKVSGPERLSIGKVTHYLARKIPREFLSFVRGKVKKGSLFSAKKVKMGPPLQRFYVMPISKECPHECSYAAALGCRKVKKNFDVLRELQVAKQYGFQDVLVPCNTYLQKDRSALFARIREAGLKPFVLVNGDERARIPLETLQSLSVQADFHLLLGPPSNYQNELVEFFQGQNKSVTATYLYHHQARGLKVIQHAPESLVERIHYLFPAVGDIWHPRPSCFEINRFLQKADRFHTEKGGIKLRGAAGYWPVDRGGRPDREVWPQMEPVIEINRPGPSIKFSVIIPSFESGDEVVKVLRSLRNQSLDSKLFEVILVDDGSRDKTLQLIQNEILDNGLGNYYFRYFYWDRSSNPNDYRAGLARNFGVSVSLGQFLCFLDSDILVPPNYLENLEYLFQFHDVIQARRDMLTEAASSQARAHMAFDHGSIYADSEYWENFKSQESWTQLRHFWKYTCTYALSVRKTCFFEAGWFSPEFFTYGFEDVDLGYRLAKQGRRFYLNQNAVYHLFPKKKQHNYHLDLQERDRALTLSSRVFYRNQLDPEIFQEFQYAYHQPRIGELKVRYGGKIWQPYYSLLRACSFAYVLAVRTYYLMWRGYYRLKDGYYVTLRGYHFVMRRCGFLFKPYYFCRYQYETRIVPLFRVAGEKNVER